MADKILIDYIESISKIYATQPPEIANQMVKVINDIATPKLNRTPSKRVANTKAK